MNSYSVILSDGDIRPVGCRASRRTPFRQTSLMESSLCISRDSNSQALVTAVTVACVEASLELNWCQQPFRASGRVPRIPALIPALRLLTMSGSCAILIPRRLRFHEAFDHRVVRSWTDVIHGPR